ncbi:MAG: hypothetical protein ACON5D_08355 [Rubripirellula sp.]
MSKIVTLEWSICRRVLDSSDKNCFGECLFRRSLGFGIRQIAVGLTQPIHLLSIYTQFTEVGNRLASALPPFSGKMLPLILSDGGTKAV